MSWELSLQNASFKGVGFDVVNISDRNSRVIAEHKYPYINGGDLEDMGADVHEVSLTAIFLGNQYEIKLKQLLNILQDDKKIGVLVHPIFGRMPEMMPLSWSFNHDAEWRNYVTFDLTFKKATKGNPIFANTSIFGLLDKILAKIQELVDMVSDVFDQIMGTIEGVKGIKSQLKGFLATFKTMGIELKAALKSINKDHKTKTVRFQATSPLSPIYALQGACRELIAAGKVSNIISPSMTFDGSFKAALALKSLPADIVAKKTKTDLGVPILISDVREIQVINDAVVLAELVNVVVDLISNDDLSRVDIEKIVNTTRDLAQETIDFIRINEPDFIKPIAKYDGFYLMIEQIRAIQHDLKELASRIIAKKPPLIMRLAPFDGTLHQIAHHFYQDFSRFDELVALNPHLTHPTFIKRGDFINGYSV